MGRIHLKQFMEEGDPFAKDAWVRHFGVSEAGQKS
jgi:hypothetical protein